MVVHEYPPPAHMVLCHLSMIFEKLMKLSTSLFSLKLNQCGQSLQKSEAIDALQTIVDQLIELLSIDLIFLLPSFLIIWV